MRFSTPIDYNALAKDEYEVLKAGEYTAQVEKSEVARTKDGRNEMAVFTFKITDEKARGRQLTYRIMRSFNGIENAQKVNEVKMRQMIDACHLKNSVVEDSDDFLGADVVIVVDVVKNNKGEDSNEVKRVKAPATAPAVGTVINSSAVTPSADANKSYAEGKAPSNPFANRRQ